MKTFRTFWNAIYMAKDFELKMKMLGQFKSKEKKYKLAITEKQMGILEYCAAIGVDSFHDLSKKIGIDHPAEAAKNSE